ncbi:hypothetical protein [Cyanobium sp. N5-Cardenillas]|uniref:hypothetical protein n=1 Tax=Cyanobium sp. N5-Cardenillas TaxID=2823720 RepID=UPI0020CB9C4A|nr:hypothetical protein [Cyanobium sp. N5-Cardenillas]MCP9785977.1 hypothetical protein [Cyanobium sp. N5-Cardenillas]
MTAPRLCGGLACLLLTGCASLWTVTNRSGLEADVRELLKTADVEPQHLDCRMVGTTRMAACSLHLSPPQTASVIRALALENIQTSSETSAPQAGPSCVAETSGPIITFGRGHRPTSLRLASGTAFEYLLLTINKATGQACIQVSYAYG